MASCSERRSLFQCLSSLFLFAMLPWLSRPYTFRQLGRPLIQRVTSSSSSSSSSSKATAVWARKKRSVDEPIPLPKEGWTTIKFGKEEDAKSSEMDDRLREAERWVSKKLSNEESEQLNRAMGIEKEVLAAIAAEEEEEEALRQGKKLSKKGMEKNKKGGDNIKSKLLKEYAASESKDAAKVKGFLELNPYICSGCGTPFQSKTMDNPGFLPKEKLKDHLANAQKIRERQEAIKILEMAGIEIDSAAAEEVLREANVPTEVIAGVRALALGRDQQLDFAEKRRRESQGGSKSGLGSDKGDMRAGVGMTREDEDDEVEDELEGDEEDDDDEYIDEDDDLDGMEIDLEELLQASEKDSQGSVANALAKSIAAGAAAEKTKTLSTESVVASIGKGSLKTKGLPEGVSMIINDIDNELQQAEAKSASTGKRWIDREASSKSLDAEKEVGALLGDRKMKRLRMPKSISMSSSSSSRSKTDGDKPSKLFDFDNDEYTDDGADALNGMFDEEESDEDMLSKALMGDSVCICQRCFRLQQYGQVEENLRPGWSEHELLTPERFEDLLTGIKETSAVVLCIVDVFDLKGSLLANLRQIAGKNPIVIAANKVDLLPKDVSSVRLTNWIHAEVKELCGLRSPRDVEEDKRQEMLDRGYFRTPKKDEEEEEGVLRRTNVHLVSCHSGMGIDKLMGSLMGMAMDHGNKCYVMGAANVGKSSFINRLLDSNYKGGPKGSRNGASKGADKTPQATVSNLPGTTLNFLKIKLPNGVTMVDTPGLINRGQLTSRLTTAELRQVIPAKPINAVTLRVSEGKCVLLGGLATVELVEGRPFFFTFFVSNEVKLHPTDATRALEFVQKHAGGLVTPPASPQRLEELGPFKDHIFEIEGDEWRKATVDIVIAGLGWVSITGPGVCKVRVNVPEGTSVGLRPPLLPYEASHSTAKFTGGRISKKSRKGGDGSSYGWRA